MSRHLYAGLAALLLLQSSSADAQTSVKLTDVIKSTGSGNISVLKDLTAPALEALRQQNGGKVVFGVDVNEAADGSEKSSAQGITVASARLEVTIGGSTKSYAVFSTETRALVATGTSTTRTEYFTLLGESGSARITGSSGSSTIQAKFDSTLTFPVADALGSASAVKLLVTLAVTNTSLGDPEAFYDFSNGFEDLAVLAKPDADFLNGIGSPNLLEQSTFRNESPTVTLTNPPASTSLVVASWTHYPSSEGYYLVAYEDRYPLHGDYDFNDLVVAYRISTGRNAAGELVMLQGTAFLVARGASYDHAWHVTVGLPGTAQGTLACQTFAGPQDATGSPCAEQSSGAVTTASLQVKAFASTRARFTDPTPSAQFPFAVNTPAGETFVAGPKTTFSLTLAAPLAGNLAAAPFTPELLVKSTSQTVTLNQRDANNYPFGLVLPDSWVPPHEQTNLAASYGSFLDYVQSAGASSQTWYQQPVAGKVFTMTRSQWAW